MSASVIGKLDWGVTMDDGWHREYMLKVLIETTSPLDGPSVVLSASGLPVVGSSWVYGGTDLAATLRPDSKFSPVLTGEPNRHWVGELLFSTKPMGTCADIEPGNPLLEPPEIGGTFAKYRRVLRQDKNGDALVNVCFERIDGEIVEVEDPRPTVRISRNVAALDLATVTAILRDAPLNNATLWGVAARHVRFSNYTWQKKYYGACSVYYTEDLEFEITEFDRWYTQQGYRRLKEGETGPPADPTLVELNVNANDGSPEWTLLDASGNPTLSPVETKLELLDASNLLLLGIPSSLA